jgi:hypothetical protein
VVSTSSYLVFKNKWKKDKILMATPWLIPGCYVLIVLVMVHLSLIFKLKSYFLNSKKAKEVDSIQAKINRAFHVISGVLATYFFISCVIITYFGLNQFLRN